MPSFYFLLYLLFIQWQQAVLPEPLPASPFSADSPQSCAALLTQPGEPVSLPLPVSELRLLSWNIYKAAKPELLADLQALSEQSQIMLLQEAITDEALLQLKPHTRFSPGYKGLNQQTGLALLSDWSPQLYCRFYQREPWLRTPKASSISRYPLANGDSLLLVNMHGINFTLGISDYRQQLERLTGLIKLHSGPVIFAGDFNSWSRARWQLVQGLLSELDMTRVSFTPDHRTRVFDLPLDQIWIRGVTLTSAQTLERTSSDHNPLLVSVHITTEEPGGDKQP
ncbi:endonuclease/exonuclease/phosphatase family protein [Pseudoalteromonas sp. T1lg76]|uniref:endonuclease/exonuclease/phosphatase family protein n=1 Tax=Pseudoalteromonas sp. T1lg76 TaxID=2077103 RepID=UPI001319F3AF|nr:endonuclease/exonuclease/phosphatase family protein [Pseudoalteromonas sp. T1lg76]